jgi:hypothetical protein
VSRITKARWLALDKGNTRRLIAIDGDHAYLVNDASAQCSVQVISSIKAVQIVANGIRQGFCQTDVKMLYRSNGRYELDGKRYDTTTSDKLDWLLYVEGDNAFLDAATAILAGATDLVKPDEVKVWLSLIDSSGEKFEIHAYSEHPAFALAIAETAMSNGYALQCESELWPLPSMPPSQATSEWMNWLLQRFKASDIEQGLTSMGFTKHHQLQRDLKDIGATENLAALL